MEKREDEKYTRRDRKIARQIDCETNEQTDRQIKQTDR